jgi:hypothetical protein
MKTTKMTPDGREIIARERAVGPHPHPQYGGKLVPYRNVTKLLLADETELFECEHPNYEYVAPNVKSVTSHMFAHYVGKRRPAYSDETLRTLIRAVCRHLDRHNRYELAASDLNDRGVRTLRGGLWTGSQVSVLYRKHTERFPNLRTRYESRASRTTPSASNGAVPELADENAHELGRRVLAVATSLETVVSTLVTLTTELVTLAQLVQSTAGADGVVTEKAQKWDRLVAVQTELDLVR